MPGREIILANNEIYHVFNRGVASLPVFFTRRDYKRALLTLAYYQNTSPPIRYSKLLTLSQALRGELLQKLKKEENFLVEIIAHCLMPNHFHLLLRQLKEGGISKFVGNFTNSYTRYLNTKTKRSGPLFGGKFKAVRAETEEQLLHLTRYIHLNPYTGYIVSEIASLKSYPYSSFPEYLQPATHNLSNPTQILGTFKSLKSYKNFVTDHADYQRQLGNIKHLLLE